MKRRKKTVVIFSICSAVILISILGYRYAYFKDVCMFWHINMIGKMHYRTIEDLSHIDYEWLSSSYKRAIPREQFETAMGDDIYDVFHKINEVNPNIIATVFGINPEYGKKDTEGYIIYKGERYFFRYDFKVRPSSTLEPIITEWKIKLQKVDGFEKHDGKYFYP